MIYVLRLLLLFYMQYHVTLDFAVTRPGFFSLRPWLQKLMIFWGSLHLFILSCKWFDRRKCIHHLIAQFSLHPYKPVKPLGQWSLLNSFSLVSTKFVVNLNRWGTLFTFPFFGVLMTLSQTGISFSVHWIYYKSGNRPPKSHLLPVNPLTVDLDKSVNIPGVTEKDCHLLKQVCVNTYDYIICDMYK